MIKLIKFFLPTNMLMNQYIHNKLRKNIFSNHNCCSITKYFTTQTLRLQSSNATEKNLSRTDLFDNKQDNTGPINLKTNPYFNTYASKIQQLKEKNKTEYNLRVEKLKSEKILSIKKENKIEEASLKSSFIDATSNSFETKTLSQKPISYSSVTPTLDSVIKLELFKDLDKNEIEKVWCEYYKQKDCLFACMTASEYDAQKKKSELFPTFVYILPKSGGYEFYMAQWNFNQCFMTPLALYHKHKENAPYVLTLTFFDELSKEKDIVLMNSEIDFNFLNVPEAQLLALQVKLYYESELKEGNKKYELLKEFTVNSQHFRYETLIEEFTKIPTL